MRPSLAARLALLALAVCGRDAFAQRVIRGVVRDSEFVAPLPGAVITVIDSSGVSGARTISDANGQFSITASPRAASIHLIRIGFRPRDLPLTMVGSSLQLVMTRIPPILDAIRVSDKQLCPGSADRGPAFQYWEQARAGLLAQVVAREANPANATTIVYERHEHVGDDLVQKQTARSQTGATKRPFVAPLSASTFAKRGYVSEDDGGRLYSAPDADVLLDESFAATHCFHMQMPDAAHTGQIGLSFTPVPNRPDSIVDIQGTIWLDRATPALRSFDFQYTSIEPAAARLPTGGHIEFRSVPNGVSFVERWALRLAILGPGPRPSGAPLRRNRADRDDLVAKEVQETGGQVINAGWLDGTIWRDSTTGLRGTITERGTGKPIANAIVKVLATSDTLVTDDHGTFELWPMVPGKYMIEVVDTSLAMFSAPRVDSRSVEVTRGRIADFRASVLGASDVIGRLCKEKPERLTTTFAGRVVLPKDAPPGRRDIEVTWQADFGGYIGIYVTTETARREMQLDDGGRFSVCGVSIDRPVKLKLVVGGQVADTTVKLPEGPYSILEWRPKLSPIPAPPKP